MAATAKQIQFRLKQQKAKLQRVNKEATATKNKIKKLEADLKKARAAEKTRKGAAPARKAAPRKKAASS
ncbi:MAG: hypothetical protein ACLFUP_02255 [Desulfobacteraceae bacterium]|jgi:cell division protein FtsB